MQKRVCKYFDIKNIRDYHDLDVQSGTLLLTDVFENFRRLCLKISKLDPEKYPGLACQTAFFFLKKVNLDFLTDIDMLLICKR